MPNGISHCLPCISSEDEILCTYIVHKIPNKHNCFDLSRSFTSVPQSQDSELVSDLADSG